MLWLKIYIQYSNAINQRNINYIFMFKLRFLNTNKLVLLRKKTIIFLMASDGVVRIYYKRNIAELRIPLYVEVYIQTCIFKNTIEDVPH